MTISSLSTRRPYIEAQHNHHHHTHTLSRLASLHPTVPCVVSCFHCLTLSGDTHNSPPPTLHTASHSPCKLPRGAAWCRQVCAQ